MPLSIVCVCLCIKTCLCLMGKVYFLILSFLGQIFFSSHCLTLFSFSFSLSPSDDDAVVIWFCDHQWTRVMNNWLTEKKVFIFGLFSLFHQFPHSCLCGWVALSLYPIKIICVGDVGREFSLSRSQFSSLSLSHSHFLVSKTLNIKSFVVMNEWLSLSIHCQALCWKG